MRTVTEVTCTVYIYIYIISDFYIYNSSYITLLYTRYNILFFKKFKTNNKLRVLILFVNVSVRDNSVPPPKSAGSV